MTALELQVLCPPEVPEAELGAGIVFFYGGGWKRAHPEQFHPFAVDFASRGMVAICTDYRVEIPHGTTPFDSVSDARSALRWARAHARELRLDSQRIVAAGGSAGGQLAAATAASSAFDAATDDVRVGPRPDALVRFNPVLDTGPGGYATKLIGARFREFSPLHLIDPATSPRIVFLGSEDAVTPVATARRDEAAMMAVGLCCDLHLYPEQKHGFYAYRESGNRYCTRFVAAADRFLASLGLLAGEPTIAELGTP